jgi:hypothetical protein
VENLIPLHDMVRRAETRNVKNSFCEFVTIREPSNQNFEFQERETPHGFMGDKFLLCKFLCVSSVELKGWYDLW